MGEETCDHILLRCPVVHNLWCMTYGLLRISWAMTDIVREEIWAWKGIKDRKKQLRLISHTIFWAV